MLKKMRKMSKKKFRQVEMMEKIKIKMKKDLRKFVFREASNRKQSLLQWKSNPMISNKTKTMVTSLWQ